MEQHNEAVALLATDVRKFYDRKEPFRVYHGSTNSTWLTAARQRDKIVDTSGLNHVLHVDRRRKFALVEPNVPMDQLVQVNLKSGLIPPVVMEFPGITVGGGFAGTGGESSSFRHGFFDRTINWCEVVLADRKFVKASPTSHADLFYGAAGSFGTPWDLYTIRDPTYTLQEIPIQTIELSMLEPCRHDYINGIIFSRSSATVMLGRLTDEVEEGSKMQRFSRAHDPWFYLHASRYTNSNVGVETVPLTDYLFRYDRGAFWTGAYAFKRFNTPFNSGSRFVLDSLMHTRKMYQALHASGYAQEYIIQDLALPGVVAAKQFIHWVDKQLGVYPLWLCPLRADKPPSFLRKPLLPAASVNGEPVANGNSANGRSRKKYVQQPTLLNVSVWGPGPRNYDDFVAVNRALENKVEELGGFKQLYAHAYYTEEEFWTIYDREKYQELRAKYDATTLPSLYDKVRVTQETKSE